MRTPTLNAGPVPPPATPERAGLGARAMDAQLMTHNPDDPLAMDVNEALDAFCSLEVSPADCQQALHVIGAYLAHSADLDPDAAVVLVGRAGLTMLSGVTEVLGRRRTFVATPSRATSRPRQVTISWLAGPPPANLPLALLDDLIAHGDTLTALLSDLADHGHQATITALAALGAPEGLAAIQDRYPDVDIILARLAEGVDRRGHLVPSTHGGAGAKLYGPRPAPRTEIR